MNVFEPRLSSWLENEGDDDDVVLSSRIRLARNLKGELFPIYEQKEEIVNSIANIFDDNFTLFKMNVISKLEKALLVEKHLISPYLMKKSQHGAVFLNEEENVSIMLNEEDHLRIQCMTPGLRLFDALEAALQIDNYVEQKLTYAFDKQFGYLTSCVTNIGTGMRASVMVHLPGLVTTKRIKNVIEAIRSLGFVVRGIYGEGSMPASNIFQVSNQVTLGKTEIEIVEDLTQVMEQIIMQERVARTTLKQKFHIALEDRVFRSYGLLRNCRIISIREAADAISDIRLGVELGFFEHISRQKMNELILFSQPAFLRREAGRDMDELEEKVIRAKVIREILGDN